VIKPPDPAATANAGSEAWQLVFELFQANKTFMHALMSEFDLTPIQGWALKLLDVPRPLTMSELADALGCDASNVTSIVDRLEARGFVERRPSAMDRRVKELALTPAGLETHARIEQRMHQPPPPIDNLSQADKEQLRDILRRALDSVES